MDLNSRDNAERILDGCIRGDSKCQQILYESLYRRMLGVCLRYASCNEEAKDLLHDGFIKVFEKLKYFKHSGSLEGWIRKIIVNNAIDNLRKHRSEFLEYEGENKFERLEDQSDDEINQMKLANLKAERIIELIQTLSPAYKAVFNLYVIEEYSHKEIAEMLGISVGTSKSNLAKAKLRLKQMYVEKYSHVENETV
ncbi:MAG TPA: RNA polymerase sigma factor [Bacteroidales bacterium]|nr:RNA polymerase sigma factor [Bacteroidales bacterium]HOE03893.1 RNA polymerase sigma factor [Bacteroidales bacterium]HQN94430.1 RNA polymerase sigma factor [Prolixibacteraceae bacterium]